MRRDANVCPTTILECWPPIDPDSKIGTMETCTRSERFYSPRLSWTTTDHRIGRWSPFLRTWSPLLWLLAGPSTAPPPHDDGEGHCRVDDPYRSRTTSYRLSPLPLAMMRSTRFSLMMIKMCLALWLASLLLWSSLKFVTVAIQFKWVLSVWKRVRQNTFIARTITNCNTDHHRC